MSMGLACKCAERRKPIGDRRWFVRQRRCNFSAFSGKRYTPSRYSGVLCAACGRYWRTKAQWVARLSDYSEAAKAAQAARKGG